MEAPNEHPAEYLVAHLQEMLAADPRTDELGIEVTVSGSLVVLTGTVATADRRQAAEDLAREALDQYQIRNELLVADLSEPVGTERLP